MPPGSIAAESSAFASRTMLIGEEFFPSTVCPGHLPAVAGNIGMVLYGEFCATSVSLQRFQPASLRRISGGRCCMGSCSLQQRITK